MGTFGAKEWVQATKGRVLQLTTTDAADDHGGSHGSALSCAGNHENLLITAEPDVVDAYVKEFAHLWKLFKPHPFQPPDVAAGESEETW